MHIRVDGKGASIAGQQIVNIVYPDRENFGRTLKEASDNSLDSIIVVTAALFKVEGLDLLNANALKAYLDECVRALKNGGLLFVQGCPEYLPELGVYLDRYLNFKYWIAVESTIQHRESGLPSVHGAVLLFAKGSDRFRVKRTRFPHQYCAFCKRTLKDWGGKAHLMHPDGYVISDVWTSLPQTNNYTQLSAPVLDTILRMLDFETGQASAGEVKGIIGPKELSLIHI